MSLRSKLDRNFYSQAYYAASVAYNKSPSTARLPSAALLDIQKEFREDLEYETGVRAYNGDLRLSQAQADKLHSLAWEFASKMDDDDVRYEDVAEIYEQLLSLVRMD